MSDDKVVSFLSLIKKDADNEDYAIKESVNEAFQRAQDQDLKDVLIAGWTQDGNLVLSMAMDSAADIIFTLELLKREVLDATRLQE